MRRFTKLLPDKFSKLQINPSFSCLRRRGEKKPILVANLLFILKVTVVGGYKLFLLAFLKEGVKVWNANVGGQSLRVIF